MPTNYFEGDKTLLGIKADEFLDAISLFMSQLNKEYFSEDEVEEMSFEELMGFGEKKYDTRTI